MGVGRKRIDITEAEILEGFLAPIASERNRINHLNNNMSFLRNRLEMRKSLILYSDEGSTHAKGC